MVYLATVVQSHNPPGACSVCLSLPLAAGRRSSTQLLALLPGEAQLGPDSRREAAPALDRPQGASSAHSLTIIMLQQVEKLKK